MHTPKSAYELRESQVSTPSGVVGLVWNLVKQRRPEPINRVVDFGAGDARFAIKGHYKAYVGIEIDPEAYAPVSLPQNATLIGKCAFRHKAGSYEACVGNPPYVRHHDIESPWKENTAQFIRDALGIELDPRGNLYLYFLCLALLKTKSTGLVALVMPFEWVSRPSAKTVREYIEKKKWNVAIYRFQSSIFEGVLTTAAIAVIDKSTSDGLWSYFDVLPNLTTQPRKGISGNRTNILAYEKRGALWARRGISPGGQQTFVLTEDERVSAGLWLRDVSPCVTTLRHLPKTVTELNEGSFRKHFVEAGERCWLIKSAGKRISKRVTAYLKRIPAAAKTTYACKHQRPWYRYETPPIPDVLFHSGFIDHGPKVLVNSIGAQAAGSVYGITSDQIIIPKRKLRKYLSKFNFERRVVAHAKKLKKVEVAQLNSVLTNWLKVAAHDD